MIALNKARNRVDQVVIGLDMTCTSGETFSTNDGFQRLKLSRRGRFSASVGPERIDAGGARPRTSRARSSGAWRRGTSRRAVSGA